MTDDTFYQVHRAANPKSTGWYAPCRQFNTFADAQTYVRDMLEAGYDDGDFFLIVENREDGKDDVQVYGARD